jgi:hypothetical protein
LERLRLVTSGTYHLEVATPDEAGTLFTPTTPLGVSIKNGAGTSVLAPATAASIASGISYDAAYTVLAALDTYTCTWTGMKALVAKEWTSIVELCGGYLFEISEMRAFDAAFANVTTFSDAKMRAARTAAEQRLEMACRVAFVPRARRLALVGNGTSSLALPDNAVRSVKALTVDGTAFTAGELAALDVREWGRVSRTDGLTFEYGKPISIFYEHGEDYPDAPVVQAAMLLAREYLVRSALSSRATVEATDVGFFRVSVAGPDRPTGLPEVDAVIADFGRRRPRVA